MPVLLTGDPAGPSADGLTVPELVDVARGGERVVVAEAALDRVAETRADLEERVEAGEVIYGVNTGFGANADESIAPEDVRQLQTNLLRSHAFGVGDELDVDEVRATMLLRLNSLLSGNSGIRPVVAERLRDALNAGVHPRIPRKGSVSASGDLAPLAHMALVLIGEGEAHYEGERLPGGEALAAAGVDPLELEAKEGLDSAPKGFAPWFQFARQDDPYLIFGHWAALQGQLPKAKVRAEALDTGCVWGGSLTALDLETGKRISVPSQQARKKSWRPIPGATATPAKLPMDYVGATRAYTTALSRGSGQTFHADAGCRHLIDADRLSVYPIGFCRRSVYMSPCPDCTTGDRA